jgi:hypothetical protein
MKQTVFIIGAQFLRFVFANEPVERLRGIGANARRALAARSS